MRRKVKGASAFTLAVMAVITLFGAEGSRAHAEMGEAIVPVETVVEAATSADQDAGPKFVSNPVVQEIPETPSIEDMTSNDIVTAANLRQYLAGQPDPGTLDKQMACLAGAIYHESKGEPLDGQLAVARVIMARAESSSFPSTYCGVVYQRSQFSFVRGGSMPYINKASRAWERAKKVAEIAVGGEMRSAADGALYFHAKYVKPRWSSRMTRLTQIDNHIFYR